MGAIIGGWLVNGMCNLLTPQELERALCLAYSRSLDDHPNIEIEWEVEFWRRVGEAAIAKLGEEILRERREADFVIPGGAEARDRERLWTDVDQRAAFRLVRDEALCAIAAILLVFWDGLRDVVR